MSEQELSCKHGQLARSCEICELEREVCRLTYTEQAIAEYWLRKAAEVCDSSAYKLPRNKAAAIMFGHKLRELIPQPGALRELMIQVALEVNHTMRVADLEWIVDRILGEVK